MFDIDTRALLANVQSIAIVGLSGDPRRPSNEVAAFLVARDFECIGVNPSLAGQIVHGIPVVASLAALPQPVDMVDIFRASEHVGGIVDEVLSLPWRPKIVWMQLGVFDQAAKTRAEAAGLVVVAHRCPKIELSR